MQETQAQSLGQENPLENAFDGSSLDTVFYEGSESQWGKIDFTANNEQLTNAYILFSQELPEVPEVTTVTVTASVTAGAEVTLGEESKNSEGTVTFTPAKGTYTLTAKKAGCLTYTVKDITVGSEDIDLGELKLLQGDLNADEKINMGDLRTFLGNFNKTGDAISEPLADFNADAKVNMSDLRVFLGNFNKTAEKDCTITYGA